MLASAAITGLLCGMLLAPLTALGVLRVEAAGPTLTAAPATNLADGQFVKLSLSGFPPSVGVAFRQCMASPANVATDCTATNTQVTAFTDLTGAEQTYLGVYAGSDSLLKNSGGTGSITCDHTHACVIAGMQNATDLTSAVFEPIEFGLSPDSCPPPAANGILGGGSAPAYRAMYAWESTVCLPPASLSVGYSLTNSVDGVTSFGNGLASFAVTGPTPPISLPAGAPSFKYAPVTTSALVLAYRIYDHRGQQITNLTLTPWLIGQIYQGLIPNWAVDADITYLNPGVQFPGRIVPFARAEHSAETYAFTSWLSDNLGLGPGGWPAGAQTIFPEPASGVTGVTGSAGMGRDVVNPLTGFFDQGNIGFMDSSTAAFYGLPTVQIRRTDLSLISASTATIQQAVADATTNADGTITPNYTTLDHGAYPILMSTYLTAPTNTIAADKGATLASFLRYAVQAGQANLPPGYAPLPTNLVNESLNAANAIPVTAPPTPKPSPSASSSSRGGSSSGGYHPASSLGGITSTTPGTAAGGASPSCTPPASPSASTSATSAPPTSTAPATTTSAPSASTSPNTAGAIQSASPAAVASPAPASAACPAAGASSAAGSAGSVAFLSDTSARYVLPSIAALALLGLVSGPAAQFAARRRRARGGPGAGIDLTASIPQGPP